MTILTLSLDHKVHKKLVMFDRYLTYPVDGGRWAFVLFDSNNDYYSPSETYATIEEADVNARLALADGIFIS